MSRGLGIFALLISLAGCTGPDRYRIPRVPAAERITVLVPGFRGTFLYDKDEVVYLTLGQAVTGGNRSLGTCDGLTPLQFGGPLTWYSVMGYRLNIYAPVLDWGEATQPGFTAFGYDWREELHLTAKKLCAFIGQRRANLITHSMGGLIALLAEAECGERFDKVVFAAVPFGGAPGLLYEMFSGSRVRMNKALLNPTAVWAIPSLWQMLPRKSDFIIGPQGEPRAIDIGAAETWKPWTLPCPGLLEQRLADRASLPERYQTPRAKTFTVVGRGFPSCSAVRLDANGLLDHQRWVDTDGDGAVPFERAQPPFESRVIETTYGHPYVLNDPRVLEELGRFLAAP